MSRPMTVKFLNRDFTDRIAVPWSDVRVKDYSWGAIGGPLEANIEVYGNRYSVWEFANMMRCPVVIRDKITTDERWWGFVKSATIYDGNSKVTISLDTMTNNMSIFYNDETLDYQTAWQQDDDSVAEYGRKDLLITLRDVTLTEAEARRDRELQETKYPQMGEPLFGSNNRYYAAITCAGWWSTLDWRYYSQDGGLEAYMDEDDFYGREIGEDDRPIAAQGFQLSSAAGWTATAIWLPVEMRGSTTDSITVALYSESGGEPDAQLAYCTLTYDYFTTSLQWIEFELDTPVALSTATTYFIRIAKAGAVDTDNFYVVGGNASMGYANGELLLWNTNLSQWVTWIYNCELNFMVVGLAETTDQIDTMIADSEFILDTDLVDESGISTNQFRDGITTIRAEIQKLLDIGDSNNKRILVTILKNLHAKVYIAPDKYEMDFSQDAHQIIRDHKDAIIPNSVCPVGIWMTRNNIIPSNVDLSILSAPSHRFIERAKYIPDKDEYIITSAGASVMIGSDKRESSDDLLSRLLKYAGVRHG